MTGNDTLPPNPTEGDRWLPSLHIGPRLIRWMVAVLLYTLAVAFFVYLLKFPVWHLGNEAAAALGAVLSVLIVFRNNAANDRWWEARKQWGQLINEIRNLALKARAHAAVEAEEHSRLARLLANFAHSLRLELRGDSQRQILAALDLAPNDIPHVPGYLAGLVHQLLDRWNRQGKLRDTIWILDVHARALMDVCGSCERIRNTPLASSYRALVRWVIVLYLVVAPWSVSLEMGWWAVPVVVIGIGFLLGIELTAEEVEEPFGAAADDLPLENYCQTIESFVNAVLEGPQPIPKAGEEKALSWTSASTT